jgi:peptidoglycan/LPS O-acetylase OafA/YrhL
MDKEFKINNFDLLRIFAASQVMVCHAVLHLNISVPPWLMKLIHAFPGVPIFFVISGFLISASYERSSSLKSYCRNRVLRIFPGLWCCIVLTVLVASLFGFSFVNAQALVWMIGQFAGAIYTPGFLKDFGVGSYNGSLWTIPVELQFYIVLPAVYWLSRKRTKDQAKYFWLTWFAFVAVACAASFALPPLNGPESEPTLQKLIRYSFFPHFYLFMTGVVLQRLKAHASEWIAGKGLYWLAAYLAFYYAVPTAAVTYVPMTLLLAVAAVSMAYTGPRTAQKLLRGNDISYGVYIYHGLLVNFFVEMGLAGNTEFLMLLMGCTYLVGYVSWIAIERPFLRRKKQTISPTLVTVKQERNWVRSMLS